MDNVKLRNRIGSVDMAVDGETFADNLAIAICTYYDDHPKRPEDDEDDDECWSPWVREQHDKIMDRIVDAATDEKGQTDA